MFQKGIYNLINYKGKQKKSWKNGIIKFQDDNDENDETLDNIQLPKAKKAPAKKTAR